MPLKKHKVWVLLSITLLLVYFAPPEEGAATYAQSSQSGASIQTAFPSKNKKPTKQVEILDLLARVEVPESEEALSVFSKAYRPPVIVDTSQNKNENEHPGADNEPIEETHAEAPPLPFKVLGKYTDSGDQVFFVKHKHENLVLHVGDVFLEKYKFESVDAKSLTFVYLPLDKKQTLNLVH